MLFSVYGYHHHHRDSPIYPITPPAKYTWCTACFVLYKAISPWVVWEFAGLGDSFRILVASAVSITDMVEFYGSVVDKQT